MEKVWLICKQSVKRQNCVARRLPEIGRRRNARLDLRSGLQNQRLPCRKRKIKVIDQIAKLGNAFSNGGSGIGASIGLRVDTLPVEEIVLNKLEIRIETKRLMV